MRKKIFVVMLFFGAVTLSGCTTEAVRKETVAKDTLTFNVDKAKQDVPAIQPSAQDETSQTLPSTPPVTPPTNTPNNKKMYTTQPAMTIDVAKKYTATLKTDVGDIVVDLDVKGTPITANNFVFLAKENFYDGTIFHRTIKGFMIQGGDPTGTGMGGPGYKFADEPFAGEYTRGTLAMANSGANTNGSQFFIMHQDTALPKNYVIFGHVTAGLDVVDKIAEAPTKPDGEGSSPVTPVGVRSVTVKEK